MKKFVVVAAAAALLAFGVSAQADPGAGMKGPAPLVKPDPSQAVAKRVAHMSQLLGLSADQQGKLTVIYTQWQSDIARLRSESVQKGALGTPELRQLSEGFRAKVDAVLTPAQKEKLAQLKEESRKKALARRQAQQPPVKASGQ